VSGGLISSTTISLRRKRVFQGGRKDGQKGKKKGKKKEKGEETCPVLRTDDMLSMKKNSYPPRGPRTDKGRSGRKEGELSEAGEMGGESPCFRGGLRPLRGSVAVKKRVVNEIHVNRRGEGRREKSACGERQRSSGSRHSSAR